MAALSENIIKSLHWDGKDKRILDGQGLYLNLRRNSKTWIFRKKHSGKTQIITLGKWPTLSCKQARLDARRYADESNISNKTVSDLIAEYKKDVVYPDSKVPKQVEGYLNHIDQSFLSCVWVEARGRALGIQYPEKIEEYGKALAKGFIVRQQAVRQPFARGGVTLLIGDIKERAEESEHR